MEQRIYILDSMLDQIQHSAELSLKIKKGVQRILGNCDEEQLRSYLLSQNAKPTMLQGGKHGKLYG